jgi:uncharacterized hydrophobic protein (TIGR00271 family)
MPMPAITATDLTRMRANLLFDGDDGRSKQSKFWVLLVLAAAIASAGVVGDSTATVIGAMIVAPLMTPIMGTVLSITTSDRDNLIRSVLMVAGGALAGIAVGYVFGLIAPIDVVAATSSQVAARVNPRLIDLVAAVATGAVGAFAQCREDVSDTLPGVAIAISLVPPLAVVGLTLEAGELHQAWGALLLFLTNVAAILLTGVVVMSLYGVPQQAIASANREFHRKRAIGIVIALVVLVAVPLTGATFRLSRTSQEQASIGRVAERWASPAGWTVASVVTGVDHATIIVSGPDPAPDTAALRTMLDTAGLGHVTIVVRLIPETRVELPGS